jgi:hypothetical protein
MTYYWCHFAKVFVNVFLHMTILLKAFWCFFLMLPRLHIFMRRKVNGCCKIWGFCTTTAENDSGLHRCDAVCLGQQFQMCHRIIVPSGPSSPRISLLRLLRPENARNVSSTTFQWHVVVTSRCTKHTANHTELMSLWKTAFIQKTGVAVSHTKLWVLHRIQRFIIVFTKGRHWYLHFNPAHMLTLHSCNIYFNIILKHPFLSGFMTKILY